MRKLQGKTKLANRDSAKKSARGSSKLTSVNQKKNVTTGLAPKTFRCTESEKAALQALTEQLQQLTQRPLTESKVLRGLIAMSDELDQRRLLQLIFENT